MNPERVPLRRAIGRGVRTLREAGGFRQDDLARSARDMGLAWTSSKVAALERGDKAVPSEELVLLPLALRTLGCPISALADLLAAEEAQTMIVLNDRAAAPVSVLREVLSGDVAAVALDQLDVPPRSADDTTPAGLPPLFNRLLAGWPDGLTPPSGIQALAAQAATDARQDAEQTAARRFKVAPVVVAAAALNTWGRSLTAERDDRLTSANTADAASTRALRGHITRELYRELQATLDTWHAQGGMPTQIEQLADRNEDA